jgi:hypothetical protein
VPIEVQADLAGFERATSRRLPARMRRALASRFRSSRLALFRRGGIHRGKRGRRWCWRRAGCAIRGRWN